VGDGRRAPEGGGYCSVVLFVADTSRRQVLCTPGKAPTYPEVIGRGDKCEKFGATEETRGLVTHARWRGDASLKYLTAELLADTTSLVGESPVWDAERERLWWVDILGREVRWTDLSNGKTVPLRRFDVPVGAVGLAVSGLTVAVGQEVGIVDPTNPADSFQSFWAFSDDPLIRFNDSAVDPRGRLIIGSMAIDRRKTAAHLWSIEPNGQAKVLVEKAGLSNGIGFSPDGETLYWVDTDYRQVFSFPYSPDSGNVASSTVFTTLEEGAGNPDGLTVDEAGGVWVACARAGEVRRYLPNGQLDMSINVPARRVTSVAFAGPRLELLVITTAAQGLSELELHEQPYAGSLFACEPGIAGLDPKHFCLELVGQ